jgi:uncharacterized membrane protein
MRLQFRRVFVRRLSIRRLLWVAAVVVVTGVSLLLAAPALAGWASAVVYACASLVCHQRPERSFHWGEAQFAVCARCTGIYVGAALASLAAAVAGPARVRRLERMVRPCLLLSAVPVAASALLEWTSVWMPSHVARSLTGLVFGGGAMVVVAVGLVLARRSLSRDAGRPGAEPR